MTCARLEAPGSHCPGVLLRAEREAEAQAQAQGKSHCPAAARPGEPGAGSTSFLPVLCNVSCTPCHPLSKRAFQSICLVPKAPGVLNGGRLAVGETGKWSRGWAKAIGHFHLDGVASLIGSRTKLEVHGVLARGSGRDQNSSTLHWFSSH